MIAAMANAYTVLWTHDTCRELRKAGRTGQRPPVAFSGVHTSLPRWSRPDVGDDVYALHVNRRVLHVVSRLRVRDKQRGECCGAKPLTWRDPAFPGHAEWAALGADGCGASAVHVDATPVRFDLAVPGDLLAELAWRNARGVTRGLKGVADGMLEKSNSLQGGVYWLTSESAAALAALVAGAASPSDRAEPAVAGGLRT